MEKLSISIGKKLGKFKAGFGTNWEDFSFDGCSNSQSNEDVKKKKITITFTHKKRPVVKSLEKKKKKQEDADKNNSSFPRNPTIDDRRIP